MMLFGETANRPVTFATVKDENNFIVKLFDSSEKLRTVLLILLLTSVVLALALYLGPRAWRRYKTKWSESLIKICFIVIDVALICAIIGVILEATAESVFQYLSPKRSAGIVERLMNLVMVSFDMSILVFVIYWGLVVLWFKTGFPRWLPIMPLGVKRD
jgi:hypothetical protein